MKSLTKNCLNSPANDCFFASLTRGLHVHLYALARDLGLAMAGNFFAVLGLWAGGLLD